MINIAKKVELGYNIGVFLGIYTSLPRMHDAVKGILPSVTFDTYAVKLKHYMKYPYRYVRTKRVLSILIRGKTQML